MTKREVVIHNWEVVFYKRLLSGRKTLLLYGKRLLFGASGLLICAKEKSLEGKDFLLAAKGFCFVPKTSLWTKKEVLIPKHLSDALGTSSKYRQGSLHESIRKCLHVRQKLRN